MERGHLAGLGLVLGLAILSGCVQPPPSPHIAVAPVPVAPAPVALVPPVWVPAPQRNVAVKVVHPVMHHHSAHHYYPVQAYYEMLQCGSDAHPCSVAHVVVPIQ
jgi:hypothetical protein